MEDQEVEGIIVTSKMVKSALEELRDFRLGEDLRGLAERVYLALHYERSSASETKSAR